MEDCTGHLYRFYCNHPYTFWGLWHGLKLNTWPEQQGSNIRGSAAHACCSSWKWRCTSVILQPNLAQGRARRHLQHQGVPQPFYQPFRSLASGAFLFCLLAVLFLCLMVDNDLAPSGEIHVAFKGSPSIHCQEHFTQASCSRHSSGTIFFSPFPSLLYTG